MVAKAAAPSQSRYALQSPNIGGTVPSVPGSGSRSIKYVQKSRLVAAPTPTAHLAHSDPPQAVLLAR
jgi:hypothetical protein